MEIRVSVLAARNLAPNGLNGSRNPYCVVGLGNFQTGTFVDVTACLHSETCKATLSPIWKEFNFTSELNAEEIRVEIWDQAQGADVLIGYALVNPFFEDESLDAWLSLTSVDKPAGEVHVLVTRHASSKPHPSVITNQQQRMVRVFLSSTFLDMHQEREEIMRKTMVELDWFCYQRGVSLTYIDMRWGITDEMGKNNLTILTCLREADHSRPYFVGLLGQRYGWHQEIDGQDVSLTHTFETAEVFPEYAWIKNYRTRSVTELEIQHGFLLHPFSPKEHSFFYARDPAYVSTLPAGETKKYLDTATYPVDRLRILHAKIKEQAKRGMCKWTDYQTPSEIGDLLLADLKAAIAKDFPEQSQGQVKRLAHENYAHKRCAAYVAKPKYFELIDAAVSDAESKNETLKPGTLTVVLGANGSGKSSLLANWWKSKKAHSSKPFFLHFVGASALASSFPAMLTRLFEEINEVLVARDGKPLPLPNKDFATELPTFLEAISLTGGMFVIFDEVDKLPSKYHDLHWLPTIVPPRVHVIISTLQEKVSEITNIGGLKKKWQQVDIMPLDVGEKKELITKKLSLYGKSLSQENEDKLLAHSFSSNPLFLATVLAELCTIGYYIEFQHQMDAFLACKDLPSLFQRVLQRWEETFGRNLTHDVTLLIATSRSGITESVIQRITKVPFMDLSPLLTAIKPMLVVHQGSLYFNQQYILDAVVNQYSSEDFFNAQCVLADHWRNLLFDDHAAHEYPWLLSKIILSPHCKDSSNREEELAGLLLHQDHISIFLSPDLQYELIKYWRNLSSRNTKWQMASLYLKCAPTMPKSAYYAETLNALGLFLNNQGKTTEAGELLKLAVEMRTELFGEKSAPMCDSLHVLALVLQTQGKLEEAVHLTWKSLAIHKELPGDHTHAIGLNTTSLAQMLQEQGKLAESAELQRVALGIWTELLGEQHPTFAIALNNLASVLQSQGKLEESYELYKKGLDIRVKLFGSKDPFIINALINLANVLSNQHKFEEANDLYNRARAIVTETFGEIHPTCASLFSTLGESLRDQGKMEEAQQMIERALQIRTELFGDTHPQVAISFNNLAGLLLTNGKPEEARKYYEKCLAIYTQSFGGIHPDVALTFSNLAVLEKQHGNLEKATELFRKAQGIWKELVGEGHPESAKLLGNIAELLDDLGQTEEATELFRKVVVHYTGHYGEGHPKVIKVISNLAFMYGKRGMLEEAREMNEKVLAGYKILYGEEHVEVSMALNELAVTLERQEKLEEAKGTYTKALDMRVKLFGENHPLVARALCRLVIVCKKLGNLDEASQFYGRFQKIDEVPQPVVNFLAQFWP